MAPPVLRHDDVSRAGGIYLSALQTLYRFTQAELEQAYGWIRQYPDLLLARHNPNSIKSEPIDANPINPCLAIPSGMRLGQIVTENRAQLERSAS